MSIHFTAGDIAGLVVGAIMVFMIVYGCGLWSLWLHSGRDRQQQWEHGQALEQHHKDMMAMQERTRVLMGFEKDYLSGPGLTGDEPIPGQQPPELHEIGGWVFPVWQDFTPPGMSDADAVTSGYSVLPSKTERDAEQFSAELENL